MQTEENKLSYSSSQMLLGCEEKYAQYKIGNTLPDIDLEEDTLAFRIGKAFHRIVELAEHKKPERTDYATLIEGAMNENNLVHEEADHFGALHAMTYKYFLLNEKLETSVICCEIEVSSEILIGYVDAVMKDSCGIWWIIDLKTASRIEPMNLFKLRNDPQLNLYANFAPEIAERYNLDMKYFGGVQYRVTTKSKLLMKPIESYVEYLARLMNSIRSISVAVSAKDLNIEKTYEQHKRLHQKAQDIRENKIVPLRNYSNCTSFFRPCVYWSNCHGVNFTKSKDVYAVEE